MGKLRTSPASSPKSKSSKLVWPPLHLPPAGKSKTGDAILTPEHSSAIQGWYQSLQGTVSRHLEELDQRVADLETKVNAQKP